MPKKFIRFGDLIINVGKVEFIHLGHMDHPTDPLIVLQLSNDRHMIRDKEEQELLMKWLETQDVENFEGE